MNNFKGKKNYFITLFTDSTGFAISILLNFITVPIALNYWMVERYGIWSLIISITTYVGLSDLGIGYTAGILIGRTNNLKSKIVIFKKASRMIIVTTIIAASGFILLNLLNINWIRVLGKIPEYLKEEVYSACLVYILFFILSIPFSMLSAVLSGFQMKYFDSMFNIVSSIIGFINLILVIYILKGSLVTYALVTGINTMIFNIVKLGIIYLKYKQNSEILADDSINPHEKDITTAFFFKTSFNLFFIRIAGILIFYTDYLVISNILGSNHVTEYSITYKLFSIFFSISNIIVFSFTPILAREYGNRNWEWISRQYNLFLIITSFIGGLTWVGGLFFAKDFIYIWAGKQGYAGLLCAFALGGYSYILAMSHINTGILTTCDFIKNGAYISWLEVIINLLISIFLVKKIGVAGVAIGTFLGQLLTGAWIAPIWIVRRSDNKIQFNLFYIIRHFFIALLPVLLTGLLVQTYVSGFLIRIIAGVLSVAIYVIITYLLVPNNNKNDVIHIVQKLVEFCYRHLIKAKNC